MDNIIAIANAKTPEANMLCGGQPTDAQLKKAKEQGYTTIINLRPPSEMAACGFDEAAAVASLGMRYVQIPVAGPQDLTTANAALLHEAIHAADGPVMIHCASGNRVGALLAIAKRHHHGLTADQAFAFGTNAGLTALAPLVKTLL
jgi:uncharacterized protein (TIGR01244 family)